MKEYAAIADRIASDRPTNVLDWGCGHGQMSSLLRERGVGTAAFDYRPDDGDGKLHRLEKYPEIEALWSDDGVTLPYESESFDAVLSCGVLEHVEDPDASLDELHRVLKPAGTLYVYKLPNRASWTEWIARRLRGRVFYHGMAPYDQLYHLNEASALLERHGFTVIEKRYANILPLLLPVSPGDRASATLWAVNRRLSGLPILRRLANNVDLVARAAGIKDRAGPSFASAAQGKTQAA
jgi:2-polyprenyl-6-hydroxyphenyl methylase/3-demethylubiquinone-9 3-methyltransferase